MKKLLCLFLSVLAVLSFAGCADYVSMDGYDDMQGDDLLLDIDYMDGEYDYTLPADTDNTLIYGYKDAIRLMMNTFDNSFTKEELKAMYPNECWTWFEEQKGLTVDDIYTGFSEKMEENWEKVKETVGENAAVKYEYLYRTDYEGEDYEALKAEVEAKYGIEPEAFGICYEVKLKKATVGSLREDVSTQVYHVAEIYGNWYVVEVLLNMPVI